MLIRYRKFDSRQNRILCNKICRTLAEKEHCQELRFWEGSGNCIGLHPKIMLQDVPNLKNLH